MIDALAELPGGRCVDGPVASSSAGSPLGRATASSVLPRAVLEGDGLPFAPGGGARAAHGLGGVLKIDSLIDVFI